MTSSKKEGKTAFFFILSEKSGGISRRRAGGERSATGGKSIGGSLSVSWRAGISRSPCYRQSAGEGCCSGNSRRAGKSLCSRWGDCRSRRWFYSNGRSCGQSNGGR